jgi:nitrogen fixation-related uncharacterized protein
VAAFFWAVNTGQYDDLDRAARDILFDDDKPDQAEGKTQSETQRPKE